MITYVDSSVVLRILFNEDQPLDQWEQIDPISSQLTRVECLRAVERYRVTAAIDDLAVAERRAGVMKILAGFELAEVSDEVLERAAEPFPTYLATLDAIHLATALALRTERAGMSFATHDQKLALAARSVGFDVLGS